MEKIMKDKIVLISGGSQGIGRVTAEKMAKEGAVVYACSRTEKAFDDPNIIYHSLDVTSDDSCKKLFEYITANKSYYNCDCCCAEIIDNSLDTN